MVRDDVQMPMQKIQNGNLTDLNLMDQDNTEAIKEQTKLPGIKHDNTKKG